MPSHPLIDPLKAWLAQEYEPEEFIYCPSFNRSVSKTLSKPKVEKEEKETPLYEFPAEIQEVEILLLSASQKEEDKQLLARMAVAISQKIAKALFLEIPKKRTSHWFEQAFNSAKKNRWVLLSEIELYQIPDLMMNYKRQPQRTLFNTPIFFLSDLSAYHKSVELKKSLWVTLLSELK